MPIDQNASIPDLDKQVSKETVTATFAMGCFWKPDALFGSLQGVVRTRVGYAGGTTENPAYWSLADHIETVQLEYDPSRISYQELLSIFLQNHNPTLEPWKRQYMSAVFFHDKTQEEVIDQAIAQLTGELNKKLHTAVYPFQKFYLAEDRHQKYKLQLQEELMEELNMLFPRFQDFVNSTAAARLNGYLYGFGNKEELKENLGNFGLSAAGQDKLLEKALPLKTVIHCTGQQLK